MQLVSKSFRFEFRSEVAKSIAGSSASSALIDQKSTALINSRWKVSTSHIEPSSGSKLINLLSLKLLTAKPVLNLSKPSASLTWKDFVSSSSAFNVVVFSRLTILFSRAPISLIVNLRLSLILIDGCSAVLYKYGGKFICAISIESPNSVGGDGSSADSPLINFTSSNRLMTSLSILGR